MPLWLFFFIFFFSSFTTLFSLPENEQSTLCNRDSDYLKKEIDIEYMESEFTSKYLMEVEGLLIIDVNLEITKLLHSGKWL